MSRISDGSSIVHIFNLSLSLSMRIISCMRTGKLLRPPLLLPPPRLLAATLFYTSISVARIRKITHSVVSLLPWRGSYPVPLAANSRPTALARCCGLETRPSASASAASAASAASRRARAAFAASAREYAPALSFRGAGEPLLPGEPDRLRRAGLGDRCDCPSEARRIASACAYTCCHEGEGGQSVRSSEH